MAQTTTRTCSWPDGCDRPTASPRGSKPRDYCEQPDPGDPKVRHDRASAFRRRLQLEREQAGERARTGSEAEDVASQPRPVSLAGVRLRDVAAEVIAAEQQHRQQSTQLVDELRNISDEEAVERQIEIHQRELRLRQRQYELEVSRLEREAADERDRREDLAEELDRVAASAAAAGARADELDRRAAGLAAELADRAEQLRLLGAARDAAEADSQRLAGELAAVTTDRDRAQARADDLDATLRAAVDTAEKAEREAAQARSAAALAAQQAAAERERREQAETRAGREVAATEDRLHRGQPRGPKTRSPVRPAPKPTATPYATSSPPPGRTATPHTPPAGTPKTGWPPSPNGLATLPIRR